MSLYEKAKELADALADSDELRRVKESELKIMIDLDAREVIEEYQSIQNEAMSNGVNYEDLPDEKKQRIEALETTMNDNEIIREYISASQELNQILDSINMIISSALSGGDQSGCSSCPSANGCGDGGSCSCPSGN